ncbi:cyclin-G2 isoform 1-T2 [Pholidichthys leucotaenia]
MDFKLMKELRANYEQEVYYMPKVAGLMFIESTTQGGCRISARCRDATVEDLWSLNSFFGYSTKTFVLAVNLLDRFLALIKIQTKHLSCISISCLHMAAKVTEEECNLTPTDELIRIGQCKFTVSDLARMERIVTEKLNFKSKAVTALTFLHLYYQITLSHCAQRKEALRLEKLEAQLKACLCRISFSKAKPSILAMSLLQQEIEAIQSENMLEIVSLIQRHLKISDAELLVWSERVAQCLSDYASPECSKPDHRRLQWKVSRRTAKNLHSYRSVPELPTIPEGCWDESESEDSCEDMMSSGEESLSSSLGSDAEGSFFPPHLRGQKHR